MNDIDANPMAYLPKGWTNEQLVNATIRDLQALPENTIHLLDSDSVQSDGARDVVQKAQKLQQRNDDRLKLGLQARNSLAGAVFRDSPEPLDPVVQLVQAADYFEFGFAVVRCDDYNDDAKWERWVKAFSALLDESLAACEGGKEMIARLVAPLAVDDDALNGVGFGLAQEYFKFFKPQANIQPGVDVGVFVAVDEETMDSLLHPSSNVVPWVWAVDEFFEFNGQAPRVDKYPGFFPVAVTSLIPDLYPRIDSPNHPCLPEGKGLLRWTMAKLWEQHDWSSAGPWRAPDFEETLSQASGFA